MAARMTGVVALLAGAAICVGAQAQLVTPPPAEVAPSWWGQTAFPYWGYADGDGQKPNAKQSNFSEFDVTVTGVPDPQEPETQLITIWIENGFREDLTKTFFVYIKGGFNTSINTVAPSNIDYTGRKLPDNAGNPPTEMDRDNSTDLPVTRFVREDSGVTEPIADGWFLYMEAEIDPQPDYVQITFQVENFQNVNRWYAGEYCVPASGTAMLLAVGGVIAPRRRRG